MDFIVYVIVVIIVIVLAVYVLPNISWRRRRRRFRARPMRSFDQWYAEFYKDKQCDKEMIRGLYEAIGKDVGADATQIYPSDRFEAELRCPEWWGLHGHELECAGFWIEEFLKPYRSVPESFPGVPTVEGLVNELEAILSRAGKQ